MILGRRRAMNRLWVTLVIVLFGLFVFTGSAAATDANGNHDSYFFYIGVTAVGIEGPDVTLAQDGSSVTLVGSGQLHAGPSKSASGSGTYVLKDATGQTTGSGTWTTTGILGLVSYGNATPEGLPDFLFGGMTKLEVSLSNGESGVLTVFCTLGIPPAGVDEGVSLNLASGGNYTIQAGGQTLLSSVSLI
jgi:hypothetical protein